MRRTGLSKGGLKFKAPALINAANNSQVPKEIHNEVLKTEKEKNKNDQDDTTEEDKQMIIEEKPENSKEQKRTRDEFQSSLEKPQPKKALLHTPKTNTTPETQKSPTSATYWTCFHTKMTNKKHKSFDDGILVIRGTVLELYDMDNKSIGKTSTFSQKTIEGFHSESEINFAGKIVVLDNVFEADEYTSGRIFIGKSSTATTGTVQFENIFKNKPQQATQVVKKRKAPLYDVNNPDAFILYTPPKSKEEVEVAVVLDPRLRRSLRPHQVQGVKFLYDCVMGLAGPGTGCILADEMGLGKTLQSICLLWTLLKQGPNGVPAAKRVIIITPSSLVKNWGKEISKWLGSERVNALMIGDEGKKESRQKLTDYKLGLVHQVLILSYEQCRRNIDLLRDVEFGLMICDEGHRLRNPQNKTTKSVNELLAKRRIILSGTPFQNNLTEFYALMEFCTPDILGTPEKFRKIFALPIEKSRDASCSEATKALGRERANELHNITKTFMLRRTQEVLEKFLPPRNDLVIFCQPSKLQSQIYKAYIKSDDINELINSGSLSTALVCIILLKKVCNHPELIYSTITGSSDKNQTEKKKKDTKDDEEVEVIEEDDDERDIIYQKNQCSKTNLVDFFPKNFDLSQYYSDLSGKMEVLHEILSNIKNTSNDRVVLVSFFKQTLNILEKACRHMNYKFLRLDGDTLAKNRQDLVDKFNQPNSPYFIFLLSTKAGGEGLNLIGANRLIIFDCDWNPSYERQAMARVWRDGQKKEVWIYRLLTAGTIEEKIFQRQMVKQAMSAQIISAEQIEDNFTKEDLKDIFSFIDNIKCETFELLTNKKSSKKQMVIDALKDWKFHESKDECKDPLLESLKTDKISFVFSKTTTPDNEAINIKTEEVSEDFEVVQSVIRRLPKRDARSPGGILGSNRAKERTLSRQN